MIRIVDAAFTRFEQHVPDLPSEPTVGSRQNVTLAALTLSFLEALEDDRIERGYAIELTGDTCWRFYRQWGQVTRAGTRLVSRDPVRRLRLSVNAFLTFPFGRPGYRFDDVAQADGRALDMRRCPVADYLGSRGAADLCAGSWCNLDYASRRCGAERCNGPERWLAARAAVTFASGFQATLRTRPATRPRERSRRSLRSSPLRSADEPACDTPRPYLALSCASETDTRGSR